MIEAINASISAAPLSRAIAEEATTSQSANPVRIQKAAVSAPYLSPHVRLAPNAKPIFVVRDVDTGAQIKQFPTEAQIRAYQKAGEAKAQISSSANADAQKTISAEQARTMIETSVQYKEERAAVKYKQEVALPGKTAGDTSTEFEAPPLPSSVNQEA